MPAYVGLHCPHCMKQHVAFEIVAQTRPDPAQALVHCFAVCGSCRSGVIVPIAARKGLEPVQIEGGLERQDVVIGSPWPDLPRVEAPEHTPEPVAQAFKEARLALGVASWTGAAACHRYALETALRLLDPEAPAQLTLARRIDRLADAYKITPDLKDWAHAIRELANDAVHALPPCTQGQAREIDAFAEIFLLYVFTLPGRLASRRAELAKG